VAAAPGSRRDGFGHGVEKAGVFYFILESEVWQHTRDGFGNRVYNLSRTKLKNNCFFQ
jgi:hypothetical protein